MLKQLQYQENAIEKRYSQLKCSKKYKKDCGMLSAEKEVSGRHKTCQIRSTKLIFLHKDRSICKHNIIE